MIRMGEPQFFPFCKKCLGCTFLTSTMTTHYISALWWRNSPNAYIVGLGPIDISEWVIVLQPNLESNQYAVGREVITDSRCQQPLKLVWDLNIVFLNFIQNHTQKESTKQHRPHRWFINHYNGDMICGLQVHSICTVDSWLPLLSLISPLWVLYFNRSCK